MSGPALAAIIAFAAGVIVTTLSNWFSKRLELSKHVTQLASVAFANLADAVCANQQAEVALASLRDHSSEQEKMYWHRRVFETRVDAFSAKARLAAFGSSELNRYFAEIERRGGISGTDATTRELTTRMVMEFRGTLGFKANEVSEQDLAAVIFGPTDAERENPVPDGIRGWPPHSYSS